MFWFKNGGEWTRPPVVRIIAGAKDLNTVPETFGSLYDVLFTVVAEIWYGDVLDRRVNVCMWRTCFGGEASGYRPGVLIVLLAVRATKGLGAIAEPEGCTG